MGIIATLDALKEANVLPTAVDSLFSFIPLHESGAGWITTGLIGFMTGLVAAKLRKEPEYMTDLAGREMEKA